MGNGTKVKKRKGFSLLEMLVVIGLLVIVTTVAVPQFKKCFEDIHINKTLDDLDSLMQSMRSYYLVMNEFPEDENLNYLPEEAGWAFQANFLGKKASGNATYALTTKPWNALGYDWDCLAKEDYHTAEFGLIFNEQGDDSSEEKNRALFLKKVSQRYGEESVNDVTKGDDTTYTYLNFSMVETPKTRKDTNYFNRYY